MPNSYAPAPAPPGSPSCLGKMRKITPLILLENQENKCQLFPPKIREDDGKE
uniref:Uncharacterized protein n=1 Tax=Arundo donax TaxID=35708 RepID=A0A0A9F961_ARUDO